jgi:hypothetical protein
MYVYAVKVNEWGNVKAGSQAKINIIFTIELTRIGTKHGLTSMLGKN